MKGWENFHWRSIEEETIGKPNPSHIIHLSYGHSTQVRLREKQKLFYNFAIGRKNSNSVSPSFSVWSRYISTYMHYPKGPKRTSYIAHAQVLYHVSRALACPIRTYHLFSYSDVTFSRLYCTEYSLYSACCYQFLWSHTAWACALIDISKHPFSQPPVPG